MNEKSIRSTNLRRMMERTSVTRAQLTELYGSRVAEAHYYGNRGIGKKARMKYIMIFKELGLAVDDSDFFHPRVLKIPLIAYVTAGIPFQWTDGGGGHEMESGLEVLDIPPGMQFKEIETVYAVRVRGGSMFPPFKDGATLFIKTKNHNEIKHQDYVIFKDREHNAWVKMVLFRNDKIILRSLNPEYEDIILTMADLALLERVFSANL